MSEDLLAPVMEHATEEYVTILVVGQLFGLPISRVQDVFMLDDITAVPLAAPEVAGVLNLRGRIITAIDMRTRLGLPRRQTEAQPVAVGIEYNGESYGLIIDQISDVLRLGQDSYEPIPANLDPRWRNVACGIHRLETQLMVILDVDKVLDIASGSLAA